MTTGVMICSAPERTDDAAMRTCGSFDVLVAGYQARVARLAHRLMGWNGDVDDIVQDVFLAALRNRGQFRQEASLWTWLTIITVNHCRKHQRKQATWARVRRLLGRASESAAINNSALRDEVSQQVRLAVSQLSARDREAVVLFHLEHRSVDEISASVGASRSAVEVRLHRARARLRKTLGPFMKE